jgi:hypothetical protein
VVAAGAKTDSAWLMYDRSALGRRASSLRTGHMGILAPTAEPHMAAAKRTFTCNALHATNRRIMTSVSTDWNHLRTGDAFNRCQQDVVRRMLISIANQCL